MVKGKPLLGGWVDEIDDYRPARCGALDCAIVYRADGVQHHPVCTRAPHDDPWHQEIRDGKIQAEWRGDHTACVLKRLGVGATRATRVP